MARAAVDHGENNWGDVRGDCGGKCLWRKATVESCIEGGAIPITSLSPHASIGS